MSFLVLLLVVWLEKFSSWRQRIQRDEPWLRQLAKAEGNSRLVTKPWLTLILLVGVPLLGLGVLLWLLQPLAYGWLALPVHLLVLLYSLGRGDLQTALGPFRDAWRREDGEAALLVAERDMGVVAEDVQTLLTRVQDYVGWQAHQGFFAVIFWYALLGPLAALGYRLVALVAERSLHLDMREHAQQVRHALDWLPARALAASLGLVGNFVALNRVLLPELLNWALPIPRLVGDAFRAAGECQEPQLGEAGVTCLNNLWQLLVRAGLFWYAVFALWTLLV
ncbi:regulatory signaling modulator protein AmpE [Serpens gallinarum]|uniref:Regulatory signaling modulator protein AmpE n=1 Tax=Serpens gallinarum TaxID=2763075 RepID=A0ABR8TK99_9PSED|nr:regulatory signaling modulator protein AmpE [Serpens gallinarum]MBD7976194.1 regulatory signaling modulator protein AmpE [Serpens gallinarum]